MKTVDVILAVRKPKISVVVPFKRDDSLLKDCIDSLKKQTFDEIEIILVKGCENPQKARNIGLRKARSNLIAFSYPDCIWHVDWLLCLYQALTNEDLDGVGALEEIVVDGDAEMTDLLKSFVKSTRYYISLSNALYKRKALRSIGYFDENLTMGAEGHLWFKMLRKGLKLKLIPKILGQRISQRNSCLTLDVGCGSRPMGTINVDRYAGSSPHIVAGPQLDAKNIKNFVQAEAQHLPFKDHTLHEVYCIQTLEHVENPLGALKEMRRVLGSGGSLMVEVPNACVNPADRVNPTHIYSWTEHSLKNLLSKFFTQVRIALVADGLDLHAECKQS